MFNQLIVRHAVALALVTGIAACSSTPPPRAELLQAEQALGTATSQDATTYAPELLSDAQRKLSDAQALMKKKKHAAARRLLQQARVDAQLAAATARANQTNLQREQIKASIESLKPADEQQAFSENY